MRPQSPIPNPQTPIPNPSMPTVLCIEAQPAVAEHARHFLEQVTPRLRFVTAGSVTQPAWLLVQVMFL